MHRIAIIGCLLFLALQVSSQEPYFPKGSLSNDSREDLGKSEWYSKELKALKEPSLLTLGKDRR